MAREEARRVLEDVDLILAHVARDAEERARILELREQLVEVERTGRFPEGPRDTASTR